MKTPRLLISILITVQVLLAGCSEPVEPPKDVVAQPTPGELVYRKTCKVCHAQSINGAPIPGNAKMWAPRAAQGIDVLLQHASEGYGLMPAKGGNAALTEAEIRSAIEYMLSKLP